MKHSLLLGCGASRMRRSYPGDDNGGWGQLTTLDVRPDCGADVVHDLRKLPYPFPGSTFDEIHAYHVLEHIGAQGDYLAFFAQFSELWRILKPGGVIVGVCPAYADVWAWGDPGHTRVINHGTLLFLSQDEYSAQCGHTAMSDYRAVYRADFRRRHWAYQEAGQEFFFVLESVKPSRIKC